MNSSMKAKLGVCVSSTLPVGSNGYIYGMADKRSKCRKWQYAQVSQ
jgi:hypothetical protein